VFQQSPIEIGQLKEFLNEIKLLLNSDGLLIANTFSNNKLYDHESVTYSNVFKKFSFIHSKSSGNRVIYAQKNIANKSNHISDNSQLASKLTTIGVDLKDFRQRLTDKPDWKEDARLLTDQFSPANLLNQ